MKSNYYTRGRNMTREPDDYTGKTTDELIEEWQEYKQKMDKDFEDIEAEERLKFLMEGTDDKLRTTHSSTKTDRNRTSKPGRMAKKQRGE